MESLGQVSAYTFMLVRILQFVLYLCKGLPNAADWVVQDDGFGFPCFYNMQTEAVVYEDPRFSTLLEISHLSFIIYSTSVDLFTMSRKMSQLNESMSCR